MNKIAIAVILSTKTVADCLFLLRVTAKKVEILFTSSVYLRQHFQWTNAMFFSKKLTTYIDSFIQWRRRAHRGAVSHQRRIMRLCHSTPVLISILTFTDPNHSALKPNTPKVWSSLHVNCQFLFLFFFDRGKYRFKRISKVQKNIVDADGFHFNKPLLKINLCTNKSGVKDPSINTCQDCSDGKAWDCTHKKWTLQSRVPGSIPVRGNIFAEFISFICLILWCLRKLYQDLHLFIHQALQDWWLFPCRGNEVSGSPYKYLILHSAVTLFNHSPHDW